MHWIPHRLFDNRVISLRRILFGAAKHYVLEKVCKPGLPRLHLITGTRLDENLQINDIGIIRLNDDDPQFIVEVTHQVRHVKYSRSGIVLRRGSGAVVRDRFVVWLAASRKHQAENDAA